MPRWQRQAVTLKAQIEDLGRRLADQTHQRGHWRLMLVALELLPLPEKLQRLEQLLVTPVQPELVPLPHLPRPGLAA